MSCMLGVLAGSATYRTTSGTQFLARMAESGSQRPTHGLEEAEPNEARSSQDAGQLD